MEVEYAVVIPSAVLAFVKFWWPDPYIDVDDVDSHGKTLNDHWCRRWFTRAKSKKRCCHLFLEALLFDFVLFFIVSMLAVQSQENDRTSREMLDDESRRAWFVFTIFMTCYIPGTLAYIFLQDFAALAVFSLIFSSAVSNVINTSDGQQVIYRALLNGGIWILIIVCVCILFCCCAAKWLTGSAVNFFHTLMEPILIGMTLSFTISIFINSWPYYLLREDNNFHIFWQPMFIGILVACPALVYRFYKGNRRGLMLERRVKYAHIATKEHPPPKKKTRHEDDDSEEEEEEEEDDDES
jgi:hypothetical protein